eukprot:gnl/MRDRNA2_/MRDRNA2_73152_c0_seq1.p1 gnl/MRDRNA2_/MRDRNA2_73152_c0~~gnl/MRDRNA2_/MRDRNA2_73152_c0_seq1.p1  ORF type:complete len:202 (-),score=30.89 gnl/MRDRNA2_/MRDRNA2_73152_c0_seq1:7-612(-)
MVDDIRTGFPDWKPPPQPPKWAAQAMENPVGRFAIDWIVAIEGFFDKHFPHLLDTRHGRFIAIAGVMGVFFMCLAGIQLIWGVLFQRSQKWCLASHILVETEGRCLEMLAELDALDDSGAREAKFKELAKRESRCTSSNAKGGDLGWFNCCPDPALESICFDEANSCGTPLGPVKTRFGFHLVWICERRVGHGMPSKVKAE